MDSAISPPALQTRADVARFAERHLNAGLRIDLWDHAMAQSCYVTDPDGHMIEASWLSPQEEWQWADGLPVVVADPIAQEDLFDESDAHGPARLPAGTEMGHVQFEVADTALAATERFHCDLLGLEVHARLGDGFLGVGVAEYRSLLVFVNRFSPQGGEPAPVGTARPLSVDLLLDASALDTFTQRLAAAHHPYRYSGNNLTVRDPSGNVPRFVARGSGASGIHGVHG